MNSPPSLMSGNRPRVRGACSFPSTYKRIMGLRLYERLSNTYSVRVLRKLIGCLEARSQIPLILLTEEVTSQHAFALLAAYSTVLTMKARPSHGSIFWGDRRDVCIFCGLR